MTRICERLLASSCEVVVVDNSDKNSFGNCELPSRCTAISLGMNCGIAYAQNRGIEHALRCGADVIVFFDQDSEIDRGFLAALVAPLTVGEAQVVAPVSIDQASGAELPSIRVNRYGISSKVYSSERASPNLVDIVISSGTAATKEVFDIVGLLDEDFFIDFVDTEWCLRCRGKSIPIRVVPSAIMQHTIGTASKDLCVTTVLVHGPTRCYYQIRNCFHLFRKPDIPLSLALRETAAVIFSRVLLLVLVRNKAEYLKAYRAAITDGLKGVVGKKPD